MALISQQPLTEVCLIQRRNVIKARPSLDEKLPKNKPSVVVVINVVQSCGKHAQTAAKLIHKHSNLRLETFDCNKREKD